MAYYAPSLIQNRFSVVRLHRQQQPTHTTCALDGLTITQKTRVPFSATTAVQQQIILIQIPECTLLHHAPETAARRRIYMEAVNAIWEDIRWMKRAGEYVWGNTPSEGSHKYFHTHSAAQCDQLDQWGETTPIVAVLYSRWEENLSGENREWKKKKKSLSSFLPKGGELPEWAASLLPRQPTRGRTFCMDPLAACGWPQRNVAAPSPRTTELRHSTALRGMKQSRPTCTAIHRTENEVLLSMCTQLKLQCHCSLY